MSLDSLGKVSPVFLTKYSGLVLLQKEKLSLSKSNLIKSRTFTSKSNKSLESGVGQKLKPLDKIEI